MIDAEDDVQDSGDEASDAISQIAEDFQLDADTPYTMTLRYPIAWGSKEISELTIRPVTGADLRKVRTPRERSDAYTLELAGYLAGQPYQVVDKLKSEDLGEVLRVTTFFYGVSQGIGIRPSSR